MDKKVIAIFAFATVLFSTSALAASLPLPTCSVSKNILAPNERVIFTPKGANSGSYTFKFIGQASTTASGPTALSFIYPGAYSVVLQSTSYSEGTYAALCPSVTVSLSAPVATSTGGTNLFPFEASSTKSLIPNEVISYPATCLNLSQNLSFGYYDDVAIAKDGVIHKLQTFLREQKYLKSESTGYFGVLTRAAVKSFQDANDIEPTGFVGPMTRARVKLLSCAI